MSMNILCVLTCLPILGRESVVHYVLLKAYDLSMVNAFKISSLMTSIDQVVKQGLRNDWIMNQIKPIFKVGH